MWTRVDESPEETRFAEMARRRVAGILHKHCTSTMTLENLLASAYRQGVEDAVDVIHPKEAEGAVE